MLAMLRLFLHAWQDKDFLHKLFDIQYSPSSLLLIIMIMIIIIIISIIIIIIFVIIIKDIFEIG